MTTPNTKVAKLARDHLKRARERWGHAWSYLSREQRSAFVAYQALTHITGNERLHEAEPSVQAALLALQLVEGETA